MKQIFSSQFCILGLILSVLMISNVYGKNPKLKSALEISNIKIKSYDPGSNTVVLEYQVTAHESFNGTLSITLPTSAASKGLQKTMTAQQTSQMIAAKQQVITKTVAVELSGNDVSMVSININLPSSANGYNKNYYRYVKIIKSGNAISILDPREKTTLKVKEIGKEIEVTKGLQTNGKFKINGVASVQSQNYTVNISGNIRINQIDEGLYGNSVTLWFRNTSNPNKWYHPVLGHTRHTHYDLLDEQGHFSFTFTFIGDLSAYNQAIVLVNTANDASFLPVPADGYVVWEDNSYKNYFNESEGVQATINGSNSNITVNENGIINKQDGSVLRYMQLAREFVIQRYAGSCPFSTAAVETYVSNLDDDVAGQFSVSWNPNQGWNHYITIDPDAAEVSTITHEYGHFINFSMWGLDQAPWFAASDDMKEGWAIFYCFAARNYINRVYGDDIYPDVDENDDNVELAPFRTGPDKNGSTVRFDNVRYAWHGEPTKAAFGCYLWNLYDTYSGGNFELSTYNIGDNDDVSGQSNIVFSTMIENNALLADIDSYRSHFNGNVAAAVATSSNDVYSFMFDALTSIPSHKMRSAQLKDIALTILSPSQLRLSWTPQSYAGNPTERNAPTGYKVYKYVSSSWQQIAAPAFGTNYTDMASSEATGLYKFVTYNSTGESNGAIQKQICTIALNTANYIEPGFGGTYKINGTNVGTSWSGFGLSETNVTIEAVPPNGFIFLNWSDGNTSQSRNITLSENVNLTANYKGHLYSNSSVATASNGQRKIAQTLDGTYFMVYESQNRIWITQSSDGVNWTNEFEVSAGTPYSICKSPSIIANENGNEVVVVWQGTNDYTSAIYLREYKKMTNSWSAIHAFPSFDSPAGFDAMPVISRRDNAIYRDQYLDGIVMSTCVVWREPNSFAGLAVVANSDGYWSSVTYIPTTNGNSIFPSITRVGSNHYGICWLDGDVDRIAYMEVTHDYHSNELLFPQNPTYVSPDGWTMNQRPSIAVNGDWRLIVTWQSFNNVAEGQSIHVREKPWGGPWDSQITSFSSSSAGGAKPIAGTFLDLSSYYVLWEVDGSIYSTRGLGTTWTTPSIIASGSSGGANTSAINRSRTALREIWRKPNGQIAVNNSGLQKTSNVEKFVSYRLNKHIITYLDSIPELAAKGYKGMIAFEMAGLSHQSGYVKSKGVEDKLRSENISVQTNNEVLKLASAYYAKGLEIPENAQLNEISNLLTVNIKDANTDAVVKEVWTVPLTKLATRTNKTDGLYREINIPLAGLKDKDVYLDVSFAGNTRAVFVDDYYMFNGEDTKMRKFFAEQVAMPTDYALHQNYPNPFNPSTTIRFDLVEPQHVTLKIYNSLGQQVREVINDYYGAGSHEVTFDASSLSSGAYFYRIVAGKFTTTKSFVLLK